MGLDTYKKPKKTNVNVAQPMPIHNQRPAIWDLVIQDFQNRDQGGLEKYKVRLQPFNGRDALVDFYQELLDAVAYIRQQIYEDENPIPHYVLLALHIHNSKAGWTVTASMRSISTDSRVAVTRDSRNLASALKAVRDDMARMSVASSEENVPLLTYSFDSEELQKQGAADLFHAVADLENYPAAPAAPRYLIPEGVY